MTDDERRNSIALPGEWALRQVLGPTLTSFGNDLNTLYSKGRDNIIAAARRKINNPKDGKCANLRVARDVLWNGAFTDDEICAEYFGGILAASRSDDGKNDEAIQFVDVIKSMSSSQLRLHYIIYNALNQVLVLNNRNINVAQGSEIQKCQIWFSSIELESTHCLFLDTGPNVLHRMGLLWEYKRDVHPQGQISFPYLSVKPTTFGVLLYAAALNRLTDWRAFNTVSFGTFDEIVMPKLFSGTINQLIKTIG